MSDLSSRPTTTADVSSSPGKAVRLRSLHVPGAPLVLPNVWDAASAKLAEAAGFPAVATSSAATAAVLGYADGEAAPVEEVLAATVRIVGAVSLPVTVDFERGYGLAPAELVERFAATGAVGLNLEDSDPSTQKMVDVAEQADFLAAVRDAATSSGVDLVVNARTDLFVRQAGSPDERIAGTIDRGARYLAAGVDCVYPIAVGDRDVIRVLAERIPGPVNVGFGQSGQLSLADLAALGVARVSFGPGLQRYLYNTFGAAMLSALASGESPFRL
jgi:2-methylisocitrate lyase-like PEP mutase family enzyme